MRKCLVASVGGSHQPVVTAIRKEKPDFTVFLCSKPNGKAPGSDRAVRGEGNVCRSSPQGEDDLPNIPTQLGMADGSWRIHEPLVAPDDFIDCYKVSRDLLESLCEEYPKAQIQVDYTGGTKSMTAGLVAAALDCGFQRLQLVTGLRPDLRAVADGAEAVRPVNVGFIHLRRRLADAEERMGKAEYSSAAIVLEQCVEVGDAQSFDWVQENLCLARALDAWDRFEYRGAADLLKQINAHGPLLGILKRMLPKLDGKISPQAMYLRSADLFENAKRRAEHHRYDDAVSRLYRCVEMLAQARLMDKLGLDTKNVPACELPESLDVSSATPAVKLGLMGSWEKLAEQVAADKLAQIFQAKKSSLMNALQSRNGSYLAHGMAPVSEEAFQAQMTNGTGGFIEMCLDALRQEKTPPEVYPEWPRTLLPRP